MGFRLFVPDDNLSKLLKLLSFYFCIEKNFLSIGVCCLKVSPTSVINAAIFHFNVNAPNIEP